MRQQTIPVHVLVVDDDAMSRELLAALLEAEGYAVEAAESGEAALTLLRRGELAPDVVLADLQMPGVSGARLADKLRRACGERTLLLAMSGSQPPEKTVSHYDGFLLKPFKMGEIASALSMRKEAAAAKAPAEREKWVVVRGPAGAALPTQKLVSIHAPASRTASKGRMSSPIHDPSVEAHVGTTVVPVLNEKIYQQLARSMPAPQLQEMYTMCVNDARARIATMRRLAEAHDGAKFVREAHSIKGGCGMLGATELHGMAAELGNKRPGRLRRRWRARG